MKDESWQQRNPRFSGDAIEAITAPGPFTEARANAVLALHLPHGRITLNLDGRVEPIDPPPDRGIQCHVIYPKVSGAPYGHFAVYADGVVYAYRGNWIKIASEEGA